MSEVKNGRSIEVKYASLEERMNSQDKVLAEIYTAVKELQRPRPVNWTAIIGVLIAFLGVTMTCVGMVVGGSWVWLKVTLQPIEVKMAGLESKIIEVDKRAYDKLVWTNGEWETRQKSIKADVDRLYLKVFSLPEHTKQP